MSDSLIPKETLSAYERWEMAALQDVELEPTQDPQAIAQKAQAEGYQKGFDEGYAVGLAQAKENSDAQLLILNQLFEQSKKILLAQQQQHAEQMFELALDIAQTFIQTQIKIQADAVLPVLRGLLHSITDIEASAILYLHPEDIGPVQNAIESILQEQNWRIIEDKTLLRGGCRLETQNKIIDASLQTRWQRMSQLLGSASEWFSDSRDLHDNHG